MKKSTLAASIAQLRADIDQLKMAVFDEGCPAWSRDELTAADICRPVPNPPTQTVTTFRLTRDEIAQAAAHMAAHPNANGFPVKITDLGIINHDAPMADDEAGRYLQRAIAAENERDELRDELKLTVPPSYIALCKRCLGTDNSENLHIACERVKAELDAARAQNVALTAQVNMMHKARLNVYLPATVSESATVNATTRPDQLTAIRLEREAVEQKLNQAALERDMARKERDHYEHEHDAALTDLAAVRAEASAEIARLKAELAGKAPAPVLGHAPTGGGCNRCGGPCKGHAAREKAANTQAVAGAVENAQNGLETPNSDGSGVWVNHPDVVLTTAPPQNAVSGDFKPLTHAEKVKAGIARKKAEKAAAQVATMSGAKKGVVFDPTNAAHVRPGYLPKSEASR